MTTDIVTRLEGALLHVEGRMADLGSGTSGGEIPRAWFAYHSIEKKLRPLIHAAHEAQRLDPGPTSEGRDG